MIRLYSLKRWSGLFNLDLEAKIKTGISSFTEGSGCNDVYEDELGYDQAEVSIDDIKRAHRESFVDEIDDKEFEQKVPKRKLSKNFQLFEKLCCKAYNIIRKEGHRLINMFLIMLSAGMPELNKENDIKFIVNALKFDYTDQEASVHFRKEIHRAMHTWSRRFDNFIHNIKAKSS